MHLHIYPQTLPPPNIALPIHPTNQPPPTAPSPPPPPPSSPPSAPSWAGFWARKYSRPCRGRGTPPLTALSGMGTRMRGARCACRRWGSSCSDGGRVCVCVYCSVGDGGVGRKKRVIAVVGLGGRIEKTKASKTPKERPTRRDCFCYFRLLAFAFFFVICLRWCIRKKWRAPAPSTISLVRCRSVVVLLFSFCVLTPIGRYIT